MGLSDKSGRGWGLYIWPIDSGSKRGSSAAAQQGLVAGYTAILLAICQLHPKP